MQFSIAFLAELNQLAAAWTGKIAEQYYPRETTVHHTYHGPVKQAFMFGTRTNKVSPLPPSRLHTQYSYADCAPRPLPPPSKLIFFRCQMDD